MTILNRFQIDVQTEPTPGTAVAKRATFPAIDVMEVAIERGRAYIENRPADVFGFDVGATGPRSATLRFNTYGYGLGSEADVFGRLMPGVGVVDQGGGVWRPVEAVPPTDAKTLTFHVWQGGRYLEIAGAVGSFRVSAVAGELVLFEWTFQGVDKGVTHDTAPTWTRPLEGAAPIRAAAGGISVDETVVAAEVVFDAGNVLAAVPDANAAEGIQSFVVAQRAPTWTMIGQAETAGSGVWDPQAWLDDGSADHAISAAFGAAGGDQVTLATAEAQIASVAHDDRNQLVYDAAEFRAMNDATVGPFSLTLASA